LKSQKCSIHFAPWRRENKWEDIGFGKNNPRGREGGMLKKGCCTSEVAALVACRASGSRKLCALCFSLNSSSQRRSVSLGMCFHSRRDACSIPFKIEVQQPIISSRPVPSHLAVMGWLNKIEGCWARPRSSLMIFQSSPDGPTRGGLTIFNTELARIVGTSVQDGPPGAGLTIFKACVSACEPSYHNANVVQMVQPVGG
jgi:hypothetical protein